MLLLYFVLLLGIYLSFVGISCHRANFPSPIHILLLIYILRIICFFLHRHFSSKKQENQHYGGRKHKARVTEVQPNSRGSGYGQRQGHYYHQPQRGYQHYQKPVHTKQAHKHNPKPKKKLPKHMCFLCKIKFSSKSQHEAHDAGKKHLKAVAQR